MDRITSLRVFAHAAQAGSLSGAARQLDMSPAMAAKHVDALEARLGVRLLHRSTRKLALTDADWAAGSRDGTEAANRGRRLRRAAPSAGDGRRRAAAAGVGTVMAPSRAPRGTETLCCVRTSRVSGAHRPARAIRYIRLHSCCACGCSLVNQGERHAGFVGGVGVRRRLCARQQ